MPRERYSVAMGPLAMGQPSRINSLMGSCKSVKHLSPNVAEPHATRVWRGSRPRTQDYSRVVAMWLPIRLRRSPKSLPRLSRLTSRLQPRRLIIAPAAVGCKPMLGSASTGRSLEDSKHGSTVGRLLLFKRSPAHLIRADPLFHDPTFPRDPFRTIVQPGCERDRIGKPEARIVRGMTCAPSGTCDLKLEQYPRMGSLRKFVPCRP